MADETFMNDGIRFMNQYHGQYNPNYMSDVLNDFREHWAYSYNPRLTYGRKNLGPINVYEEDINNMIGQDILSPAESMIHNRFNNFSRYGYLDPSGEAFSGAREYLFFSKPDLHLVDVRNASDDIKINPDIERIPFFDEAFKRYRLSYYSLQQTYKTGKKALVTPDGLVVDLRTKFMPLLSNMVSSTLELPDISAGEVLNNQNLYQINTSYREGSELSDNMHDFSLEFRDTKYLDVYMLFKIYDEYMRAKYTCDIYPTKMEYIFNKVYPEAFSIWKLIVDDTGRIIYWGKAVGVTPMSVPRSAVSNIEGTMRITVNFKAQFVKDMDPVNLMELNYLTARSLGLQPGNGMEKRIFETAYGVPNKMNVTYQFNPGTGIRSKKGNMNAPTWVAYPYILINNNTNPYRTGHNVSIPNDPNSKNAETAFHRLIWINPKAEQ